MAGVVERHRGVVPSDEFVRREPLEAVIDQAADGGGRVGRRRRQTGGGDLDPRRMQPARDRWHADLGLLRLLHVQDRVVTRRAGEKVLRPLKHQVPSQVREADERGQRSDGSQSMHGRVVL